MLSVPRCLVTVGLAGFLSALPACSRNDPGQNKEAGFLLTGKVLYMDGDEEGLVKYGYVVLFPMEGENRVKPGDGKMPVHGKIDTEGRYAIPNAPKGMTKICVLTDPDLDPHKLLESLMGKGMKDKKGHPGLDKDKDKGMPFKDKKLGDKKLDKKVGDKVQKEFKDEGPPPDKKPKVIAKPDPKDPKSGDNFNPLTSLLSPAERQTLRDIHAKYGSFENSPLLERFDPEKGAKLEKGYDIRLYK